MNRRGSGEMIMFFAFMVIMTILGGGIVWGTGSFYGQGYEFRDAEIRQIEIKLRGCFLEHDFFKPGFDVQNNCSVSREVLSEEHLVQFASQDIQGRVFSLGTLDYLNQCYFTGSQGNDNFPRCVNGTVIKNGERFIYVIGSNQHGSKA